MWLSFRAKAIVLCLGMITSASTFWLWLKFTYKFSSPTQVAQVVEYTHNARLSQYSIDGSCRPFESYQGYSWYGSCTACSQKAVSHRGGIIYREYPEQLEKRQKCHKTNKYSTAVI